MFGVTRRNPLRHKGRIFNYSLHHGILPRVAPAFGGRRASGPAVRRDRPQPSLDAPVGSPDGRSPAALSIMLASFATSRYPPPRVAPAVAGRRASGPSRPTVRRDSPRSPPAAPVGPPGGRSPAARSTMPPSPAPGTDRLAPL